MAALKKKQILEDVI